MQGPQLMIVFTHWKDNTVVFSMSSLWTRSQQKLFSRQGRQDIMHGSQFWSARITLGLIDTQVFAYLGDLL